MVGLGLRAVDQGVGTRCKLRLEERTCIVFLVWASSGAPIPGRSGQSDRSFYSYSIAGQDLLQEINCTSVGLRY